MFVQQGSWCLSVLFVYKLRFGKQILYFCTFRTVFLLQRFQHETQFSFRCNLVLHLYNFCKRETFGGISDGEWSSRTIIIVKGGLIK